MNYLSPGVYVNEIPSGDRPIAGVGTSTAGFIGVFGSTYDIPRPATGNSVVKIESSGTASVEIDSLPANISPMVRYGGVDHSLTSSADTKSVTEVKEALTSAMKALNEGGLLPVEDEARGTASITIVADLKTTAGKMASYLKAKTPDYSVVVGKLQGISGKIAKANDVESVLRVYRELSAAISDVQLLASGAPTMPDAVTNLDAVAARLSPTIGKKTYVTPSGSPFQGGNEGFGHLYLKENFTAQDRGQPVLCTNFGEFERVFGGFSCDAGQATLAHAVYGFFLNGGTRCWVVRANDANGFDAALNRLAAIDEIAIVAAPGRTSEPERGSLSSHVAATGAYRVAILDCSMELSSSAGPISKDTVGKPSNSNLTACYFPWIEVADPVGRITGNNPKAKTVVPPSGHIAGLYARVDARRGVHKAPANEVVQGALGLKHQVTTAIQDGLNTHGINCIRKLNGNILVWGARTTGGDVHGEYKYINVRRSMLYLSKSIDLGTQWAVFEPNTPALWGKIKRSVGAFLTNAWRDGMLFGETPEQAFYIKCDEELNPPAVRDAGQLIIQVGVAIVRPAEFVVFNISQWSGPGK